jgi:hypothetical protein
MDASPLILGIVGHLVGDYLLQTDWMAQNKKAPGHPGADACLIHCVIWTFSVCLFAGWGIVAGLFLFLCHYAQDRTQLVRWWMTLRWKDQTGFMQAPLSPWSMIVVDNVWHVVQLWAAWRFLT